MHVFAYDHHKRYNSSEIRREIVSFETQSCNFRIYDGLGNEKKKTKTLLLLHLNLKTIIIAFEVVLFFKTA